MVKKAPEPLLVGQEQCLSPFPIVEILFCATGSDCGHQHLAMRNVTIYYLIDHAEGGDYTALQHNLRQQLEPTLETFL